MSAIDKGAASQWTGMVACECIILSHSKESYTTLQLLSQLKRPHLSTVAASRVDLGGYILPDQPLRDNKIMVTTIQ